MKVLELLGLNRADARDSATIAQDLDETRFMNGRHYSSSRLIHVVVVVACVIAAGIVVLAASLSSNDADLWLNLASEGAGVLLGGSLVAYLFERILRREEQARIEREAAERLAGASRAASMNVNQAVGEIATLVSVYLTRALNLRPPSRSSPLVTALQSLSDQLQGLSVDEAWDLGDEGRVGVIERLDDVHKDQMTVGRPLITGVVHALDHLRTSVVPLLQTVDDVELLTLLSAAESHAHYFKQRIEDWSDPLPVAIGPAHAFKQLPGLLTTCADTLALIESRTDLRFLFEDVPTRAPTRAAWAAPEATAAGP